MKKTYLNLRAINMHRAPKLQCRRMFGTTPDSFRAGAAYKSDGDDDTDDGSEQALLLKRINSSVAKQLATRATSTEVKIVADQLQELLKGKDGKTDFPIEALRSMADEKTGVLHMITEQGIALQQLKTTIQAQPKDMSIRSQCQSFLDKNKETIDKIKNGGGISAARSLPEFEVNLNVRAAANPMLPTTVTPGGTAYVNRFEIQPGINELLRPEPTFWDFIKKGSTNSETYRWLNKTPTEGAAAFIAPGVYKPAISFGIEVEVSNAKKVAVSAKMATELLEDIDGFETYVTDELYYQLMQKVNDTLQGNGAGTTTIPEGLQHMSIAYDALTGVATTNPNFWDVIKAMVTMLRVTRFRGQIVAFVNPVDLANGVMTKAQNQGQLFIPPVTGAMIVEDLNIPLGYVQVVALDYYKLLIYKGFRMAWGWENDDFTKNLVTVIGEMRLHQFHSSNYDGFAIYDSIANVEAAITAV